MSKGIRPEKQLSLLAKLPPRSDVKQLHEALAMNGEKGRFKGPRRPNEPVGSFDVLEARPLQAAYTCRCDWRLLEA